MLIIYDDPVILSIFVALTAAIYGIILIMFIMARRKYKGGIVDKVIRYIIATVALFLIADIALIVLPTYGLKWAFVLHIVLKVVAMSCLAKGGLELFARQA